MNCEKCQELLSDFLDGAIDERERATFNAHLEECLPCYNVHAELNSIVSFCRDNRSDYYIEPPNSQALWLRIRNTVEGEQAMAASAAARQNPSGEARRESWWSRMMGRSWEMSFPQAAMAVVAIILVASLATFFGLRGWQGSGGSASETASSVNLNSTGSQTYALTRTGGAGDVKTAELNRRMWQQQQIKYWSQIVEERKGHWSPQVRADFEHNLNLLDESVEESLKKLSAQPHDEVSEEMLDAALSDKMELLKEFSDL